MRKEKSYCRDKSELKYFDPREYDLAGRIGKLKTPHGVIETPYLFPVIDPTRQQPSLKEVENIGFNAIITNAYLFYKRNRGKPKDIHKALNWNKPIMTDSGGYQVLVYGDIEVTNETIVKYEKTIGVDIGVILDIPTGTKMTYTEARQAVEETFKRATEALTYIMDSEQLWVLPIQGAPYIDLLTYSSIRAWRYPYHIHALGSPTVLLEKYDYAKIVELVGIARMFLPPQKPLHVFGVGHPMIIPFLVALGADLFDSASYILYARDNRYMTETGTKRLDEISYLPCNCPVCSRYTAEELKQLPYKERVEALALHNLYILRRELNLVKQAIKEGRLWELMEYRSKAHPSLREAFMVVKKYIKLMTKSTPRTKSQVFATYLQDEDSLSNPRIILAKKEVSKILTKYITSKKIVLIPAIKKPYTSQKEYLHVKEKFRQYTILFYHLFLGLFPPELTDTYPFFQHEMNPSQSEHYIDTIAREITNLLERTSPEEVVVFLVKEPYSYRILGEKIASILNELGVKTSTYTLDVLSSQS